MTEEFAPPNDPLAEKFGMSQEKWAIVKEIVGNSVHPPKVRSQKIIDNRHLQRKLTDFIPKG